MTPPTSKVEPFSHVSILKISLFRLLYTIVAALVFESKNFLYFSKNFRYSLTQVVRPKIFEFTNSIVRSWSIDLELFAPLFTLPDSLPLGPSKALPLFLILSEKSFNSISLALTLSNNLLASV